MVRHKKCTGIRSEIHFPSKETLIKSTEVNG